MKLKINVYLLLGAKFPLPLKLARRYDLSKAGTSLILNYNFAVFVNVNMTVKKEAGYAAGMHHFRISTGNLLREIFSTATVMPDQ